MFQYGAFQCGAYQYANTSSILLGGGGKGKKKHSDEYHSFIIPYDALKEEQYLERLKLQGAAVEERLLAAEQEKSEISSTTRIADEYAEAFAYAEMLAKAERNLDNEINALLAEKRRLMRMIDDEEAILLLLLSRPLH